MPRLKPKPQHLRSVLHKVALRQVFLIVLWFSSQWRFSIQSPTINSNPMLEILQRRKQDQFMEQSTTFYICKVWKKFLATELHTKKYLVHAVNPMYRGADKSLARSGRKPAKVTEDF